MIISLTLGISSRQLSLNSMLSHACSPINSMACKYNKLPTQLQNKRIRRVPSSDSSRSEQKKWCNYNNTSSLFSGMSSSVCIFIVVEPVILRFSSCQLLFTTSNHFLYFRNGHFLLCSNSFQTFFEFWEINLPTTLRLDCCEYDVDVLLLQCSIYEIAIAQAFEEFRVVKAIV